MQRKNVTLEFPHTVSIASFNILSSEFSPDPECQRFNMMMVEIKNQNPDIICFQEVDRPELLSKAMQKIGYTGIWSRKYNGVKDSLATYWKDDMFRHSNNDSIKLMESTSQIVTKTELMNNNFTLCIWNCHFKSKAENEDIRIKQVDSMFNWPSFTVSAADVQFIAGDFNCTLNSPSMKKFKEYCGMRNAYEDVYGSNYYTTAKIKFGVRIIRESDYIFHGNNCRARSLLSIPHVDELGEDLLPSHLYPSDHFMIMVNYEFKKRL